MLEILSQIENGTIIRLKNYDGRDWVCIHYTKCNMHHRIKHDKHNKNHTGFYLFGGLWKEGDALTDEPYCKCLERLERGMLNNVEIVGHIKKDYEKYLNDERM